MTIRFDNSYANLPQEFYAEVDPTPVSKPKLVRFNNELAEHLGMDAQAFQSEQGLAILAGNAMSEGARPIAMAYSGHQFGGFSPQLGDGRAVLLGEVVGDDGQRRDIQLKGSGPTPFSRRGDGRSALGPVLREYIVSEAMAALGVPTTRALAAVESGDVVLRECRVPGGVFTRVASSHIRIGTFQWFYARQDDANLKLLADYAIERHYPDAKQADNPYLAFLDGVVARQAKLIAHWMLLGFIHGVMNTDNMSISGETIDYGPCAFMDTYHSMKVFSSIDDSGRYAYGNQAPIGLWNLSRFAETLLSLIDDDQNRAVELAKQSLSVFETLHHTELERLFTAKIGIAGGDSGDWEMVGELLTTMEEGEADFTLVFRHLADSLESEDDAALVALFNAPAAIQEWLGRWRGRLASVDRSQAIDLMKRTNPIYIPRNHRIEEAIQASYSGNYAPFHRLVDVLQKPFTHQPNSTDLEAAPAPGEIVRATFCGT
ncbi:MAG: YdiU family protein [Aureliella sp.]